MRSWLALAFVAALAAPAAAQRPACAIEIARAPDDVRPVVEQWLSGLPSCSIALEVRIVRTDGGLYIVARDDRGTVRDRVVPDADTAGALIASWADDGQGPALHLDVHTELTLVPPIAPPLAPPAAQLDAGEPARLDAAPERSAAVSGLLGVGGANLAGVRAEVDLYHHDALRAGAALAFIHGRQTLLGSGGDEEVTLFDAAATIYIAYVSRRGAWEVRPAFGAGAVRTRLDDLTMFAVNGPTTGGWTKVTPLGEVSLSVSRDVFGKLALTAGGMLLVYGQSYEAMLPDANVKGRSIEALFTAGLRMGL
jgi:hypothetical protein